MVNNLKIVWLCNFSNQEIRKCLSFRKKYIRRFLKSKNNLNEYSDYGIWITNGIEEFKKNNNIELHIISPHWGISNSIQEFTSDTIHYHFFRTEEDYLFSRIYYRLTKKYCKHDNNACIINNIINKIQPDLIHIIGAENPWYGKAVLSIPEDIIILTSLQTLMSDKDFINNYPIDKKLYEYRSMIERKIINRSNYIGTTIDKYRSIIQKYIKKDCNFLPIKLAVGEKINISKNENKIYDFVYFAANINKAVDLAIEAFAIVIKSYPQTTLDIIGNYSEEYKMILDEKLKELGISNQVTFEGHQLLYSDVIKKIRRAKYALLPLKIDYISGTIREAMFNGLPVLSTITSGTPRLNEKRQSILLSEIGNHQELANNMIRLLKEPELNDLLINNAANTVSELYGNEEIIRKWVEVYTKIINKTI